MLTLPVIEGFHFHVCTLLIVRSANRCQLTLSYSFAEIILVLPVIDIGGLTHLVEELGRISSIRHGGPFHGRFLGVHVCLEHLGVLLGQYLLTIACDHADTCLGCIVEIKQGQQDDMRVKLTECALLAIHNPVLLEFDIDLSLLDSFVLG